MIESQGASEDERLVFQGGRKNDDPVFTASEYMNRSRLQPEDLGLVACDPSVAGATPQDTRSDGGESSSATHECEKLPGMSIADADAEVVFADAGSEQFAVSKDQSWFQPDSPYLREPLTLTPREEISATPHSPTPLLLAESTDTADGPISPRLHSETTSELIGDKESSLEHAIFPSLTVVAPPVDAEVPKSSATSVANEVLDIAAESHELTIAFEAGVESSRSFAGAQQTSYPSPDAEINHNADATTIRPVRKPAKLRRKMMNHTPELETEATSPTPPTSEEEKSAARVRRPRQTLYERHGQKFRCLKCSALFATRVSEISLVACSCKLWI